MSMLPTLRALCRELGYDLNEAQERALIRFRQRLYEVNVERNLTRVPFQECEQRHFAESVMLMDLLPKGCQVLDLGTGPGFPAYPLAVVRPDLEITAVDSNGKMIGFLQEFELDNLNCQQVRVEDTQWSENFDVVTGRAVAPLAIQLEISAQACRVGGRVIPYRSSLENLEVAEAGKLGLRLTGVIKRNVNPDEADRAFPIYEKVSRTPREFPRAWGAIKRQPLV